MALISYTNSYIGKICVAMTWWFAAVVFQSLEISGGPIMNSVNSHWRPATATWYGSPEGDGSDGNFINFTNFTNFSNLSDLISV